MNIPLFKYPFTHNFSSRTQRDAFFERVEEFFRAEEDCWDVVRSGSSSSGDRIVVKRVGGLGRPIAAFRRSIAPGSFQRSWLYQLRRIDIFQGPESTAALNIEFRETSLFSIGLLVGVITLGASGVVGGILEEEIWLGLAMLGLATVLAVVSWILQRFHFLMAKRALLTLGTK